MAVDIKDLRRRLGDGKEPITQAKLGEMLGVDQATISRLEKRGAPEKGPWADVLARLDAATPEPEPNAGATREAAA